MSCDENVSNNLRKELSIVERQLKECDDLIIKSQGEGDESKKSVMISEAVTCMEDIKGPVNKLSTAARYVASVCDNVKLHDSLTKKGTKNILNNIALIATDICNTGVGCLVPLAPCWSEGNNSFETSCPMKIIENNPAVVAVVILIALVVGYVAVMKFRGDGK